MGHATSFLEQILRLRRVPRRERWRRDVAGAFVEVEVLTPERSAPSRVPACASSRISAPVQSWTNTFLANLSWSPTSADKRCKQWRPIKSWPRRSHIVPVIGETGPSFNRIGIGGGQPGFRWDSTGNRNRAWAGRRSTKQTKRGERCSAASPCSTCYQLSLPSSSSVLATTAGPSNGRTATSSDVSRTFTSRT
jgi:hypothetical protein